jgi:hypothetical protein
MSSTDSGASLLQRALVRLVDASRRHAWAVVLAGILLALGSRSYASHQISVNTYTDQMLSVSLPWRQRDMALDRAFAQFQDLLVAVIGANVPEEAEATARELTRALSADRADLSKRRTAILRAVRPSEILDAARISLPQVKQWANKV